MPADRLLQFSAADGWAPLCAFLGVPEPDEPFPRINDTEAYRVRQTANWRFYAAADTALLLAAAAAAALTIRALRK